MTGVASDEDLVPLSALQHLLFCERQFALIHVEQLWTDNALTVQGQHLHQRADAGGSERRPGVRIVRGLPLRSTRLGLIGKADIVEFHDDGVIVPVEYKRGKSKVGDYDRVQLCAQALCLEEMHGKPVIEGALYYAATRRRETVMLDDRLREETANAALRARALLDGGMTPRAVREPKCDSCSLLELCLPDAMSRRITASQYIERALAASLSDTSLAGDR
jgi:CRISPR-associated exonuclease Cas4